MPIKKLIQSDEEMQALGVKLAADLHAKDVIFFQGPLGAGKTTLIRGILRGLDYGGFVKSPSYSLVEIYQVKNWQIVHVDLYRLAHAEEIQHLGLSDYLTDNSILLIEWPEKALHFLPKPTATCQIEVFGEHRQVKLLPNTPKH